jgi:glutamate---cysteine ligase / carboxylate-amine ligase
MGAVGVTPSWARWRRSEPFTVGVEEEVMMVRPEDWSLAQEIDAVLPEVPADLAEHMTAETHGAAIELATDPHPSVGAAVDQLAALRARLEDVLEEQGLRAAAAGTHPSTVWHETVVSSGSRYQFVYGSMRELARREPTFALHVHVGVEDPEDAVRLHRRLRIHLPLLLAVSVNSPFWQGRDTGLASARTPLFQAFPRVGIPRGFRSYAAYVEAVDLLIRCGAIPEPTFLWWDVRPQPRFGTIEVRIMDVQTSVNETAALVALVQSIARREVLEKEAIRPVGHSPEVLVENRFLAARDGMDARLIDPARERRVPARAELEELLELCGPHAEALGCAAELRGVRSLAARTGADRQLELARNEARLPGLVAALADAFLARSGEDQAARAQGRALRS